MTRGFLCKKVQKLVKLHTSAQRLRAPLLKEGQSHRAITWAEAQSRVLEKIEKCIKNHRSIVYYSDSGSTGALKNLEKRLFNQLPRVWVPRGSLCWGAGIAAQRADFGRVLSHPPQDIINAKTIVLWGRNPAWTNPHLLPWLKEARAAGSKLVLLDPIKSATAKLSHMKHFAPLPGSDGLLALGLAGALIQKGSKPMPGEGLTEYLCLAASLEITEVCMQTGLSREEFDELLSMLSQGPVQFWLGYGLQRYYDSVNTVRHIDALAATLGSIGISGGGVNYAHTWWDDILDYLALTLHPPCPRETFPKSRLGEFLAAEKPDLLFITKANPAVQAPDLAKVRQGLASTGFSVVFEHFYTDTARLADLVLPTTGFLEETDLYLSNMWHGVINYAQPVLKPPGQARPEREVFQFLAQELGLDFPHKSDDAWLEDLLRPASSWGITLEELQKESRGHPPFIPWQNHEFATQHRAFAYVSTLPQPSLPPPGKIRLLTPHQADNMHSQLFEPGHQEHVLKLHPTTSEKFMLVDGGLADLTSGQGTLRCRIKINSDIARDLGVISQGIPCWRAGQGVNILTPAKPTDGDGAAYNECFCSITPLTGL